MRDTGELYAVDAAERECFVIGVFASEQQADAAMKNWAHIASRGGLNAIIAQARGGARIMPPPEREEWTPDLDDVDFTPLDYVLSDEDRALLATSRKFYRGVRDREGDALVLVITDGKATPLTHVAKHSLEFEWGYGGSGPADLALSIIADYKGTHPTDQDVYYGRRGTHPSLYQAFKFDFIAGLPQDDGWVITAEQIDAWMQAKGRDYDAEETGEEGEG